MDLQKIIDVLSWDQVTIAIIAYFAGFMTVVVGYQNRRKKVMKELQVKETAAKVRIEKKIKEYQGEGKTDEDLLNDILNSFEE